MPFSCPDDFIHQIYISQFQPSVLTWCQSFDPQVFQLQWRLSPLESENLGVSLENSLRDTWDARSGQDLWTKTRSSHWPQKSDKNKIANSHKPHSVRTYRHYIHREILPAKSSRKIWPCDWRALGEQQQLPQHCWTKELSSWENPNKHTFKQMFSLVMCNITSLWPHSITFNNLPLVLFAPHANL